MESRALMRLGALLALGLLAGHAACAADPDALWKIVDGKCATAARAGAEPKPCAAVDLARGVAILKDNAASKPYHFLAIPTARVTGIEDDGALADRSFEVAWEHRGLVATRLGRPMPDRALALAVNSRNARSQNQLHVHIDCVRPDVRAAADAAPSGDTWAPLAASVDGHRVIARRAPDAANPIALLAEHVHGSRADWTLLRLAAPGGGALLLAHNDAFAHGEAMMDTTCQGF